MASPGVQWAFDPHWQRSQQNQHHWWSPSRKPTKDQDKANQQLGAENWLSAELLQKWMGHESEQQKKGKGIENEGWEGLGDDPRHNVVDR